MPPSTSCFKIRHFLPPTPLTRPWLAPKPDKPSLSAVCTPERLSLSGSRELDTAKLSLSCPADVSSRSALFSVDKDSLFSGIRSFAKDKRSAGMFMRSFGVELDTGVLDLVICEGFGCCCWDGGDVTVNRAEDGGFWSRPQQTCKSYDDCIDAYLNI